MLLTCDLSFQSPFEATLLTRGLKTLPLRMRQHCESARKVADYLTSHPKVREVFYLGLASHPRHEVAKRQMSDYSGVLFFELKGGLEAGKTVVEVNARGNMVFTIVTLFYQCYNYSIATE